MKKLKLTDVRFSRRDDTIVVAAPDWAYDNWGLRAPQAWTAIDAAIKRRMKQTEDDWKKPPEDPKLALIARMLAEEINDRRQRWRNIKRHYPSSSWRTRKTCKVCQQKFI